MPRDFDQLWIATCTRTDPGAGTDSRIALSINVSGNDVLEFTSGDTAQDDLEAGQANVYEVFPVPQDAFRLGLTDSSIRVGIRGGDEWHPDEIFVWGLGADRVGVEDVVFPLAFASNLTTVLSTNRGDQLTNRLSLPVRLVSQFEFPGSTTIRRILMLTVTYDEDETGTDSDVVLQISNTSGDTLVDFQVPGTDQRDLERGQANWYYAPVRQAFTRADLDDSSMRLIIQGNNAWLLQSFFLFGLDTDQGRPQTVVPLVYVANWRNSGRGWLSTDPSDGNNTAVPSVSFQVNEAPR